MHYNNIIQSVFIMLKVLCAHLFILFYSPLNPGKQTSFYCLHNFTFSRMPCSWNHTSCSLFRAPLLHLFYSFTSMSLQSCLTLFRPHRLQLARLLYLWDSPGKNTGIGCHVLLQGILPTQGTNPCLIMSPALAGEFFTTILVIGM